MSPISSFLCCVKNMTYKTTNYSCMSCAQRECSSVGYIFHHMLLMKPINLCSLLASGMIPSGIILKLHFVGYFIT